ncbi:MAG: RidA family protein [Anaerolineae bacterium]|nr:RidA family protein [Anaerolineae bacterium]
MDKTIISTHNAPVAAGPYSQAVRTGNLLFLAGQVGVDPATGDLVEGGVQAQTEQVMKNLGAVLEAAGASFANAVKTTVFLADIGDFAAMNEVYGRYVTPNPPARSTFQVAALPRGALVEIEMIAVIEE